MTRWVANAAALLGIIVSLPLLWRFHSGDIHQFQFVQDVSWIPSVGARYTLGIDGISLLMVMLTLVLTAISICSSWGETRNRGREYYALLLLLETCALGVFMSLDLVLFYFFWGMMLVPMYFLIGVWGSKQRVRAAMKFFLYSLIGSLAMLLAIVAVYASAHTFSVQAILQSQAPLFSANVQKWLFWGFFAAFAIRTPMFPFHTWLPDAYSEAPMAASVMLAGIFVPMGPYGFLRFSLPMFPDAAMHYRAVMIALSLIAILYASLICLTEKDLKRLIAYFSIAYLGFCTLGIFALTPLGLDGSVIQMLSQGISIAGLLLIAGVLHDRQQTASISDFAGFAGGMPMLAAVFFMFILSAIGIPLLNGFVGEFAILRGAFEVRWQFAAFAVLGMVFGAAAMLWLYQRTMFGPVANRRNEVLSDLRWHEYAAVIPLIALALWIGIHPAPVFGLLDKPVQGIVGRCYPAYYTPQNAAARGEPALDSSAAARNVGIAPAKGSK